MLARRRGRLLLGLVIAGVIVLVAVLATRGGGPQPDGASSEGAVSSSGAPGSRQTGVPSITSAAPTAAATTDPGVPPVPVEQLPPSQPPVGLQDEGAAGDGVTGALVDLTAVDGQATGPGNVAGPALRVTVQLTNGTGTAMALDSVTVTATHGPDAVPASPLDDPAVVVFSGSLEPGASAEGVYVFSVPLDSRGVFSVQVSHGVGAPYMVFTGPAV
ncbi:hypothetical protein [Geodermatophilus sp. Leaf369]|uniref:hypothetical protein n=1 Tax=Geodermatophilus sp. Leaf369 TaxID=1736354 RepID=UPI000B01C545|nr:hypothetical protein [Geodermatophilus sp. Leaf369]